MAQVLVREKEYNDRYAAFEDHGAYKVIADGKNPQEKFREAEEDMNNKPIVNYNSKADILYIVAKKGKEEEFVEIAPGLNAELDENSRVIGIEILNASNFLKPVAKPLYKHMQVAYLTHYTAGV